MRKFIILIIAILVIYSCEPETSVFTKYIVKNNSSYNIKLTIFNFEIRSVPNVDDTTFRFSSGSEIVVSYGGAIGDSFYPFPFGSVADSAYIIFNDSLQIIYRQNDLNPRNILDINSYEGGKVSDTYFEYTYSITDEDYENADLIE